MESRQPVRKSFLMAHHRGLFVFMMGVRTINRFLIALVLSVSVVSSTYAAFLDDIGYTRLQAELGGAVPDGSGVKVTQVEALVNHPDDCPSPNPPCAFAPNVAGRTITDGDSATPVSPPFSGHAGSVGGKFYGNASTTPGIGVSPSPSISAYAAGNWLQSGYLRVGTLSLPAVTSSRVANHSYVGSFGNAASDLDVLRRIDWLVATDEYVQVAGFIGNSQPLLGSAFNAIAVYETARTGTSGSATVAGDAAYAVEHTRPDLVVPDTNPSSAAPRVSSAAALLIDTAHSDPSLSNGSTTNRNGDTIYNAERPEVVKAALMAGADRSTNNTHPATPADITDYRVDVADQTANGLDRRYGAGQLNIYNSYHVINAGEQDSLEDNGGGGGLIGTYGFDYDPSFGALSGGNTEASYFFSTGVDPVQLLATLAWNIEIGVSPPGNFNVPAELHDLDLFVYDVSDPENWVLVTSSESDSENTENIWSVLDAGRDYMMQVRSAVGAADFNWDYALAWNIAALVPLALEMTRAPHVATTGQFYWWQELSASGGLPPYTYSIIAGWLPWPLTLDPQTGVISGIPTVAGIASFTVQVMDANSETATLDSQISVMEPGYVCGACHGAASF